MVAEKQYLLVCWRVNLKIKYRVTFLVYILAVFNQAIITLKQVVVTAQPDNIRIERLDYVLSFLDNHPLNPGVTFSWQSSEAQVAEEGIQIFYGKSSGLKMQLTGYLVQKFFFQMKKCLLFLR